MIYLGIDPGASGGIAAIWPSGLVEAWPMPETERDVHDVLFQFNNLPGLNFQPDLFTLLELVGPMPGNGAAGMFHFGRNYGLLRGLLVALGIVFDDVRPPAWQKAMGIPPRGKKTQTQHKNVLKAKAQQLFPQLKITHATADALLLAEFCRRSRNAA